MILGLFMLAPSLKDFGPTPLETWEVRYTQPEPATEDCPTAAAALLRFLRNTPGCDFGARSCGRRVHRTLETSLPYLAWERRRRPCHSQDGSRCRQAGCQHTAMHTSKSHRRPALLSWIGVLRSSAFDAWCTLSAPLAPWMLCRTQPVAKTQSNGAGIHQAAADDLEITIIPEQIPRKQSAARICMQNPYPLSCRH